MRPDGTYRHSSPSSARGSVVDWRVGDHDLCRPGRRSVSGLTGERCEPSRCAGLEQESGGRRPPAAPPARSSSGTDGTDQACAKSSSGLQTRTPFPVLEPRGHALSDARALGKITERRPAPAPADAFAPPSDEVEGHRDRAIIAHARGISTSGFPLMATMVLTPAPRGRRFLP